jgi:hypothetical protein
MGWRPQKIKKKLESAANGRPTVISIAAGSICSRGGSEIASAADTSLIT